VRVARVIQTPTRGRGGDAMRGRSAEKRHIFTHPRRQAPEGTIGPETANVAPLLGFSTLHAVRHLLARGLL